MSARTFLFLCYLRERLATHSSSPSEGEDKGQRTKEERRRKQEGPGQKTKEGTYSQTINAMSKRRDSQTINARRMQFLQRKEVLRFFPCLSFLFFCTLFLPHS